MQDVAVKTIHSHLVSAHVPASEAADNIDRVSSPHCCHILLCVLFLHQDMLFLLYSVVKLVASALEVQVTLRLLLDASCLDSLAFAKHSSKLPLATYCEETEVHKHCVLFCTAHVAKL